MITIPTPATLLAITWSIIGFMLARAFKNIDHTIQETTGYKDLDPITQKFVAMLLDFLHHFWIGLLLMVYYPNTPEIYWFGYGLFIDDLPDLPARFKKYFGYLTG